jgi:hypothetical protein
LPQSSPSSFGCFTLHARQLRLPRFCLCAGGCFSAGSRCIHAAETGYNVGFPASVRPPRKKPPVPHPSSDTAWHRQIAATQIRQLANLLFPRSGANSPKGPPRSHQRHAQPLKKLLPICRELPVLGAQSVQGAVNALNRNLPQLPISAVSHCPLPAVHCALSCNPRICLTLRKIHPKNGLNSFTETTLRKSPML